MANMKKYDPRLESLVMETRTKWADDIGELAPEDRRWLTQAVHRNPQDASNILYERSHTGFIREITVNVSDIERLYQERLTD